MSIGSLNELQQIKWPYGAVSQVVNGQTSAITYAVSGTLPAGYYAFNAVSLNNQAAYLVASSASRGLTVRIKSKETRYFELTSPTSDLVFESEGALPTAESNLIARVPGTLTLRTLAYGAGTYVGGSTNTDNFVYVSYGTTGAMNPTDCGLQLPTTSTYAAGKFVLGCSGAAGGLTSSTNGTTWFARIDGRGSQWNAVRYLNNVWIAGGDRSKFAISTDAITWTWVSGMLPTTTASLAAAASASVAIAGSNTNVAISTTGIGWSTTQVLAQSINTMVYASTQSQFVVAGASGLLATSSPDALSWTTRTSTFGTSAINEVAFAESTYVAVGASGQLRTSTDAVTWTTRTSGFGTSVIRSVDYGAALWVSAGVSGTMRTSTDTITWNTVTSGFGTTSINRVRYLNTQWVAVGEAGQIRTSPDATTWTTRTSGFGTSIIHDVTYFNGYYIACGAGGTVRFSTDAITWNLVTWDSTAPTQVLHKFFVYNGRLNVVGASGAQFSSADGANWNVFYNSYSAGGALSLAGAAYYNGVYFIGGNGNLGLRSTDGTTWSRVTVTGTLTDVVAGPSGFVSLSGSSTLYTSTDAITWTLSTLTGSVLANCTKIYYHDSQYILLATSSATSTDALFTSPDALAWTARNYVTASVNLRELVRDATTYAVVDSGVTGNMAFSTSTSAASWVRAGIGSGATSAVATFGNGFVVVAGNDTIFYAANSNLNSWTRYATTANNMANPRAGAYGGGTYMFTSVTHTLWSANLTTWTASTAGPGYDVVYDAFTNTFLVADATNANQVNRLTTAGVSTPISVTYVSTTSLVTRVAAYNGWYAIGKNNSEVGVGRFITDLTYFDLGGNDIVGVAIGEENVVALDTNGRTFYMPLTDVTLGSQMSLSLSVTNTGTVSDATSRFTNPLWRAATTPWQLSAYNWAALKYTNGAFLALAQTGQMASSTDGITWSFLNIGLPSTYGVYANLGHYGDNQIFAGATGAVFYSSGGSLPSAFTLYQVSLPTL